MIMDTNENITFCLEDPVNYLENETDNNNNVTDLVGQMLQNFNSDIDTTPYFDFNGLNGLSLDNITYLDYFIKKEMYNGNDELYYSEEYKIKDLMKICQYYGIASSVKVSKCKKQDIISTIIYFENSPENYNIVFKRQKMWAYMTELLKDPKMKCFLLW